MMEHVFSLRVTDELREKLEQLARQEERTAGAMLRALLKQELTARGMLAEHRQLATAVTGQGVTHDRE
jgi:predicted transcriptional regulator